MPRFFFFLIIGRYLNIGGLALDWHWIGICIGLTMYQAGIFLFNSVDSRFDNWGCVRGLARPNTIYEYLYDFYVIIGYVVLQFYILIFQNSSILVFQYSSILVNNNTNMHQNRSNCPITAYRDFGDLMVLYARRVIKQKKGLT